MKDAVKSSSFGIWLSVMLLSSTGCLALGFMTPVDLPALVDCTGILPNCSFEEVQVVVVGGDAIEVPAGYTAAQEHSTASAPPLSHAFLVDDTVARSGKQSVKMPGASASSRVALTTVVPVDGGKTYKFSVWFRSVDGIDWNSAGAQHEEPEYLTVRLQVMDEANQYLPWTDEWVIPGDQTTARVRTAAVANHIHLYTKRRGVQDDGWYPLEVTLHLPQEARNLRISLMNWYGRPAGARYNKESTVWYDDISLIKLD